MGEKADELSSRFEDFSRRLDVKIREFNTTGQLAIGRGSIESLSNRRDAIKVNLDRAIRSGAWSDVLKLDIERHLNALIGDLARMEQDFAAAATKGAKLG